MIGVCSASEFTNKYARCFKIFHFPNLNKTGAIQYSSKITSYHPFILSNCQISIEILE